MKRILLFSALTAFFAAPLSAQDKDLRYLDGIAPKKINDSTIWFVYTYSSNHATHQRPDKLYRYSDSRDSLVDIVRRDPGIPYKEAVAAYADRIPQKYNFNSYSLVPDKKTLGLTGWISRNYEEAAFRKESRSIERSYGYERNMTTCFSIGCFAVFIILMVNLSIYRADRNNLRWSASQKNRSGAVITFGNWIPALIIFLNGIQTGDSETMSEIQGISSLSLYLGTPINFRVLIAALIFLLICVTGHVLFDRENKRKRYNLEKVERFMDATKGVRWEIIILIFYSIEFYAFSHSLLIVAMWLAVGFIIRGFLYAIRMMAKTIKSRAWKIS